VGDTRTKHFSTILCHSTAMDTTPRTMSSTYFIEYSTCHYPGNLQQQHKVTTFLHY